MSEQTKNSGDMSAAKIVRMPVIIHVKSNPPAEPVCRAISAETIKIPDPIIDPATIIVESSSPSSRTNPVFDFSSSATSVAIFLFLLLKQKSLNFRPLIQTNLHFRFSFENLSLWRVKRKA
jgi:hypothetical protein